MIPPTKLKHKFRIKWYFEKESIKFGCTNKHNKALIVANPEKHLINKPSSRFDPQYVQQNNAILIAE